MRKRRVESCFKIAAPLGVLRDGNTTWHFMRWDFYLRWQVIATSATLTLFPNHRLLIEQTVQLHRTEPQFGGVRWWFLCPDCQRRVLYLCLPQNAHHFSCRSCHNLSYESAQSSRSPAQKSLQCLGREMGITTREAKLWFRLTHSTGAVPDTKRPILNKVRRRRSRIGQVIAKLARENGLSI